MYMYMVVVLKSADVRRLAAHQQNIQFIQYLVGPGAHRAQVDCGEPLPDESSPQSPALKELQISTLLLFPSCACLALLRLEDSEYRRKLCCELKQESTVLAARRLIVLNAIA
ncbi:hypothetical protein VOLCADRAFT_95234 [Volvox carteri f. nagariensis]|uniref:Uncharacterized protein n=1 Tax=Volvox carteri f. nagariensis TaxID=3068 RepID=D8U6Y8_VOLCA|nr:uncharacterized protein VOLCADRAFT_95234 [Volvox carteri f. nagariensis]EFJ44521.1 hypothetical protein VOLCADRAFT_95234 [Volvox carteri f. nagariensis]|eukprot:XP_002954371.1 hypothetical protein VOLCADRAFT_95234 [Volvox carteri f. nagariensis]